MAYHFKNPANYPQVLRALQILGFEKLVKKVGSLYDKYDKGIL